MPCCTRRVFRGSRRHGNDAGGVSYGFTNVPDFPTAAAVAEEIHADLYLIRDTLRGRSSSRDLQTGGLALRARPPATVRVPAGDGDVCFLPDRHALRINR